MGKAEKKSGISEKGISARNANCVEFDGRRSKTDTRRHTRHVKVVDDIGTVHCEFDSGRSLGLIDGEDDFRALTAQELAEEETAQGEDKSPVLTM